MKDYMLARLKERSTWLGVISLLTAAGMTLTPQQSEAMLAAGMAMAGIVAAFFADVK